MKNKISDSSTNSTENKEIEDNTNIRQINISLHSFNNNGKSIDRYRKAFCDIAEGVFNKKTRMCSIS